MDIDFRSDVNAPEWCCDRDRALFYAICAECDAASVKLELCYQMSLTLFATVLSRIETLKAIIGTNRAEGKHTVDLFETLVLALSLAEQFQLKASALCNLILLTSPDAIALQKELLAPCEQPVTQ